MPVKLVQAGMLLEPSAAEAGAGQSSGLPGKLLTVYKITLKYEHGPSLYAFPRELQSGFLFMSFTLMLNGKTGNYEFLLPTGCQTLLHLFRLFPLFISGSGVSNSIISMCVCVCECV